MATRGDARRPRAFVHIGSHLLVVLFLGLMACVLGGTGTDATRAALAPVAHTTPTATAPKYTFGLEPATATKPDGRPELAYVTAPGARIFDHVAVLNYSTVPLRLQITASDALNTATGGFTLLPAGQKSVLVGAWTTMTGLQPGGYVTVPARTAKAAGEVVVPVSISIPTDASPGDHDGGLVASLAAVGETAQNQKVTVYQRVGTRIFIRLSGTLRPDLAVRNLHVSFKGSDSPFSAGTATVHYTIANIGNAQLGGTQSVSVGGLFGSAHATKLPSLQLLLPGNSVPEVATVHGVYPGFDMTTKVTVYPLVVPGQPDPNLPKQFSATKSSWELPWPLLAFIVLLFVLALLIIRLIRNRPGSGKATPTAPVRQVRTTKKPVVRA